MTKLRPKKSESDTFVTQFLTESPPRASPFSDLRAPRYRNARAAHALHYDTQGLFRALVAKGALAT